jgi:outer membrane receptor for ferrienterochelin and colicins
MRGWSVLLFILMLCGVLSAQDAQSSHSIAQLDSLLNIPVSVSARYEQTAWEAPSSVTVITSEDIQRYGYRTLDEALKFVRGFFSYYDRNYAYIGVRGFGRPSDYNDRLLLMLNGHILNDNIYGNATLGTDLGMSMDAVERIEIVRGPNSTLYGTGAIFAVINIVTKRGLEQDGLQLSIETGSLGKIEGAGQFGKAIHDHFEVFVSGIWGDVKGKDLYYKEFDSNETDNG